MKVYHNLRVSHDKIDVADKEGASKYNLNMSTDRDQQLHDLALGAVAPDFSLPGTDGQLHPLEFVYGQKSQLLFFYRGD